MRGEDAGAPAHEARDAQVDRRTSPARRAGRTAAAPPTRRGTTSAISPARRGAARTRCIARLMIQNDSTGFDQKSSASMRRARPPEADVVAPLGHLAGDLGVVGLPGILEAVRARERDVEQQAEQDDEEARLAFRPVVRAKREAHESADAKRAASPRCNRDRRHLFDGLASRQRSTGSSLTITASCAASSGTWGRGRRRRSCSGGLRRLEYRGYDSAGVAIVGQRGTQVLRCRGKLAGLEAMVAREPPRGTLGIGHTRWATHGRPTRPTPTRTRRAASRWSTTASSRTTWRCARGWRRRGASSPRRPTPRSSPT